MQHLKITLWLLLLCAGVTFWWYEESIMEIDYKRLPFLIDPQTGAKRQPVEMYDLRKVLAKPSDYINETNAQQRLYDLQHELNFENPVIFDRSYSRQEDLLVSGWPVADQMRCGAQLGWILDQLNSNKDYSLVRGRLGYELTNFMDSFGQPGSGLYSGVLHWMGSYKGCVASNLNSGDIKTRYCIGKLRPDWWPKNETMTPKTRIRVGICLPETCDTRSFTHHNHLIESLTKFNLPQFFKENHHLDSIFCLPDERSPLRQIPTSGFVFILVMSVWLAIVLTATILNESLPGNPSKILNNLNVCGPNKTEGFLESGMSIKPEERGDEPKIKLTNKILAALSIRTSIKTFKTNVFKVRYNRGERVRVDLGCMDSIKVFMALLVILGHSSYLTMAFSRSLSNKVEMATSISGRLVLSVARLVDTFFLFFGVLTTYTLMRKFNRKQLANPINWLCANLGILLRISPVYMFVFWYSKTISPYTSSGPWWDYGVENYSVKGVCMQDPWWKSIPYFGSMGEAPVTGCNLPAWFLISYAQIAIVIPLITYLILEAPNGLVRYGLVAFLALASASNSSYRLYTQKSIHPEGFTQYGSLMANLLERFESTGHMSTLVHLGSVAVGCVVGYLLRMYELGQIRRWPNWMYNRLTIALALLSTLVIVVAPVIGAKVSEQVERIASLEEIVGFNLAFMLTWQVLNSILVIYFTSIAPHTVITRFFSHSFWHAFSRLGLSIYLIHWEVLFVTMTSYEQGPSFAYTMDIAKLWLFGSSVSIFFAFCIHILLEAPLSALLMVGAKPFLSNSQDTDCNNEVNREHVEVKIKRSGESAVNRGLV